MFGPETSTANRAMMGGMLGNNSCGSNSIVYGSTRDHTLAMRGFLSDGTETEFRAPTNEEFDDRCRANDETLETRIYRGIRDWLSNTRTRDEIRRQFPKPEIHRRNTGYAVDLLMDAAPLASATDPTEKPFDFCKLIAGSEGTLFFATEIKLKCLPLPPPASGLLCVHFENVDQALRATQFAIQQKPFACELIDRLVLEGARRNIEQRENAAFVVG